MSERIRKLVMNLNIRPADVVLEIGCGHGIAASLVCEFLETGRCTALDRSAKMIEAAVRRNASHVASGKAEFLLGDLETFDFGRRRFDVVFAFRVGLFMREPERARRLACRWLKPGGTLLTDYDRPS